MNTVYEFSNHPADIIVDDEGNAIRIFVSALHGQYVPLDKNQVQKLRDALNTFLEKSDGTPL